jgi:electron transfer flavoprotein beta subunit
MAAKNKPVERLTVANLGLDGQVGWAGARQEITAVRPAEARQAGEKLEDDGTAHERIVAFLEELKII